MKLRLPAFINTALAALLAITLPAPASAQTITRYSGPCDASAAVALDADHFVVANDEHNTLHIYRQDRPTPVAALNLADFLATAAAKHVDSETCAHILQLDTHIRPEQACGAYPINGLLLAARQRGLTPHLIDRCNSGDTAGDKQRVVGYAAFSFTAAQDA